MPLQKRARGTLVDAEVAGEIRVIDKSANVARACATAVQVTSSRTSHLHFQDTESWSTRQRQKHRPRQQLPIQFVAMSSPSYSSLFDYDLSSESNLSHRSPSPPRPRAIISQRPRPPRLSSPRLFQDIFSSNRPPLQPTLNQTQFRESFAGVSRALSQANTAVQEAEQALQAPVVDLTDSPPGQMGDSLSTMPDPPSEPPPEHAPVSRRRTQNPGQLGGRPTPHFRYNLDLLPPEHVRRASDEDRAVQRQQAARRQWQQQQEARARQQNHRPRQLPQPFSSSPRNANPPSEIESVDLTQVDDNSDLAYALAKQRTDAIKSQQISAGDPEARTPLTAYKCPICMEIPREATTTICGHLFCHRCIIDTLKWSEQQRTQDLARKADGVCPVCRKPLKRKDKADAKGRHLVPLQIKLVTKKASKDIKGKQRADSPEEDAKVQVKEEYIGTKRKRQQPDDEDLQDHRDHRHRRTRRTPG